MTRRCMCGFGFVFLQEPRRPVEAQCPRCGHLLRVSPRPTGNRRAPAGSGGADNESEEVTIREEA